MSETRALGNTMNAAMFDYLSYFFHFSVPQKHSILGTSVTCITIIQFSYFYLIRQSFPAPCFDIRATTFVKVLCCLTFLCLHR